MDDDLGPRFYRLSFAYREVILLTEGSPSFTLQMMTSQAALLHLGRRVGLSVQLLSCSSALQTQVGSVPSLLYEGVVVRVEVGHG